MNQKGEYIKCVKGGSKALWNAINDGDEEEIQYIISDLKSCSRGVKLKADEKMLDDGENYVMSKSQAEYWLDRIKKIVK